MTIESDCPNDELHPTRYIRKDFQISKKTLAILTYSLPRTHTLCLAGKADYSNRTESNAHLIRK